MLSSELLPGLRRPQGFSAEARVGGRSLCVISPPPLLCNSCEKVAYMPVFEAPPIGSEVHGVTYSKLVPVFSLISECTERSGQQSVGSTSTRLPSAPPAG
ncbi:hypothetical protein AOLI_G00048870 [Acnodon oligacanthus]